MRALAASLALIALLSPRPAGAAVDELLIHRLMARLSGAEPLDDGTRIVSRYVLRPALLDKAAEELTRELAACGVSVESDPFHVAVVDFSAAARLGDQYAVFGEDAVAYAASPTGPFEAVAFPGTAYSAQQVGDAYYAAGDFSSASHRDGARRWYLSPGRYLAEYQGHVYGAGATGAVYVSAGAAPFAQHAETGIAFGGLAASAGALWAVSGRQLLRSTDGVVFVEALQSPHAWSAIATVAGTVYGLTVDGSIYDTSTGRWTSAPWKGVDVDGWSSPGTAFRIDGDLLFGMRAGVFIDSSEPVSAPVSPPMVAVAGADGAGLLVAGRRGSLAYLAAGTQQRRLDAPVWAGEGRDPRFAAARNLIVHRPGSKLLLSAHLDSIAALTPGWNGLTDPAPGADDDLSGVAALAAVACARPRSAGFDVLFTAGEEIGLAGSYWEALGDGKGYDYDTMLTVDEIALKTRMVFIGYQDGASYEFAAALTRGVAPDALTRFFVAGEPTLISRADHYAYFLRGVKTAILSAGVPPPSQYHTIDDTLDRADVQPVIDTARMLEGYVAGLEPAPRRSRAPGGCATAQPGAWAWLAVWALVWGVTRTSRRR